jgi:hypothetical protein
MAATVRVDAATHAALVEIARAKHLSLTEALSRAVVAYRREVFLEGVASDYAALRSDPKAWAEEVVERNAWEMTAADGLHDEPPYVQVRDAATRVAAKSAKAIRSRARRR